MEPVEVKGSRFIIVNQMEVSLKYDDQVYKLLVSLKVESKALVDDLAVMCIFSRSISKGHL